MRLVVLGLSILACYVLVWAAPAQAGIVHVFGSSFGSEGSGSGQFKEPEGIAVNDTTHDVYVADYANNRVQEFNSTGTTVLGEFNGSGAPTGPFVNPSWIAVDNSGNPGLDPSAGDVYVVDDGHKVIDKFSASGAYEGQITGTCEKEKETPPSCSNSKFIPFKTGPELGLNVAVDPRGVLWVLQSTGEIDTFSDASANEYLSKRTTEFGYTYQDGFAVDSGENFYLIGDVFVGGSTHRRVVQKFSSTGTLLINGIGNEEVAGEGPRGIAVDPVGGEVYAYDTPPNPYEDDVGTIGAFSLSGSRLEYFGAGHLTAGCCGRGVAVDASNGTVYAVDRHADRVVIFDAIRLPTVAVGALTKQQPRSVTLNGTVNPEGSPVTSCAFEYDTREYKEGEGPHGTQAPCSPASLGSGTSPVAVSAHLGGLVPQTSYYFRLVAASSFGTSQSAGREFFTGPRLGGEFVTEVASSSATLQARIDPNGADTHYYFQYGTSASYGIYVPAPPPGVDLGSASGEQSLSVHLQDLLPSTEYHYRVVVIQGGEAFEEPDRTFTTQPAGGGEVGLPDGRAWELVSPPNKGAALIAPFEFVPIQAASDGSAITYGASEPIGENAPAGRTLRSQILSKRGLGGWGTQDIGPPHTLAATQEISGEGFEFRLFSPDLTLAAIEQRSEAKAVLSPEAAEGNNLYLRNSKDGSYLPLLTAADVPAGVKVQPESNFPTDVTFAAATPDLSHVIVNSPLALTPEAPEGYRGYNMSPQNLYEWSAGSLQLVNILPDGLPELDGGSGTYLAGGEGAGGSAAPRAVSSDGRWVAWTVGSPYGDKIFYKGVYVRDMVEGQTMRVGGAGASYQTMSSDGSLIFFLENGELYAFDTATGTQTDLTADHGAGESSAGVKEALLGLSEDGSYVYFVASGVLASSTGAVSGEDNVYVMHDEGGVWSTKYVATLSSEDELDWYFADFAGGRVQYNAVRSRVSPNGRYLSFMSDRSLTGYDNLDANSGKPDEEAYLYDGLTGRLACASCNPTGARPVGVLDTGENLPLDRNGSGRWTNRWLAAIVPAWNSALAQLTVYQPRYLLNNGRLFFDSPDALVPQDTNGLMDVYEYEPAGIGGCQRASVTYSERSGGCVSLISAGTSSAESTFYDASENGDDVFFITTSKLVASDHDTALDVYDAHVCSNAVPCVTAPVSPPPCTSGDSCKPAPSPQPEIFGTPPSGTFNGAGNVTPTPPVTVKKITKKKAVKCRKGFTKEKNKCVKNKKSKRAKKAGHGGRTK
jgi:DNA-binding beta-propeller fold protein YncE